MKILGINGSSHDNSVFVIDSDQKKIFAVDVERVSRIKHDHGSIQMIAQAYPDEFKNIDHLAIANTGAPPQIHPLLRLPIGPAIPANLEADKILRRIYRPKYYKEYNAAVKKIRTFAGILKAGPYRWFRYFLLKRLARLNSSRSDFNCVGRYFRKDLNLRPDTPFKFYDHHLCHAASAYYFGGFDPDESVLSVTMDGYGDGYFSKVFRFQNNQHELLGGSEISFLEGDDDLIYRQTSIGVLYSAFTFAMGLHPNSDEGKVEALAAYGDKSRSNPILSQLLGTCRINPEKLSIEFNETVRDFYSKKYLAELLKKHGDKDFAAAIQSFLEIITTNFMNVVVKKTGIKSLALSGGVAANVIMNLQIWRNCGLKKIYVFPAMADNGVSVGAALLLGAENRVDWSWLRRETMPYWGPEISAIEIEKSLESAKTKHAITYQKKENWEKEIAARMAEGQIGALVQGRMEFGPRALGNRSIIADPRKAEVRDIINKKVKGRPWYQPFCPSTLEEERERLFESTYPNKHMTFAFKLKDEHRSQVASAVHVDGTGRPQFVEPNDNPKYWKLIKEFKNITGYGIIINTSFNLHGRTIVATAEDALTDFLDCHLDFLVLGDYVVERVKQN